MRWLDRITNSMDLRVSRLGRQRRTGNPACCSPWGHKVSDVTYQLNNNNHEKLRPETKSGSLGGSIYSYPLQNQGPNSILGIFFFFLNQGSYPLANPSASVRSPAPRVCCQFCLNFLILQLAIPLLTDSSEKTAPLNALHFSVSFLFQFTRHLKRLFLTILSSLFFLSGGLIQFTYRITEVEILHSLFNPIRFSFPLLQ